MRLANETEPGAVKHTRLRLAAASLLALYWAAMFLGTHLPQGVGPGSQVSDKLLHFGAYAGLAFLLAAALSCFRARLGSFLFALLIAALYGVFDELTQMPVPGRQADVHDWVADVLGAGVGVLAFVIAAAGVTRLFPAAAPTSTQEA